MENVIENAVFSQID